jgi:proliferating cell nuclear antigen
MRLKTVQATAIKSVFEVLKDIISDINFVFDKDGVSMRTLDNAKVTFINLFLDARNFEVYECKERIIAGLNITNTFKLLKVIGSNDTLEISLDEKMHITIDNAQKKSNTVFHMNLLDINDDDYNLNDLKFSVTTVLQSVNFQRIIRDMSNFSNYVVIKRFENKLQLRCVGDFVEQTTELECADTIDGVIEDEYSLKYINMFTKATSISSNVSIQQENTGSPIAFKYFIANLGEIHFFLAPKTDQ